MLAHCRVDLSGKLTISDSVTYQYVGIELLWQLKNKQNKTKELSVGLGGSGDTQSIVDICSLRIRS